MDPTASQGDVTANNDTIDISDEQVDKYFESGGTDIDLPDSAESQESHQTDLQKAEDKTVKNEAGAEATKQDPEKDIDRNYKAAMHEEREKRKDIQRQLEENKRLVDEQKLRAEKLETTFQNFIQRVTQPQEKVPSFEEDPIEALRYQQEQIAKKLQQHDQNNQQRSQQEQTWQAYSQFMTAYHNSAKEFAKTQTDFTQAYTYLHTQRKEELLDAGYNTQQADILLQEDEAAIVANAFSQNKNPAEIIYNLAKRRGFTAAQQQTSQAKNNVQKIQAMEKGMQASKSLSNAGGKAENTLSLESLASMDAEELDSFLEKNWSKLSKLMT